VHSVSSCGAVSTPNYETLLQSAHYITTNAHPSDPSEEPGFSRKGRSTGFGPDITEQFLAKHSLQLLVRSHEVKEQGFEMTHNGKCCTVFSAPHYCSRGHNFAAVMRFVQSNSMDATVVHFKSARGMEGRPVPPALSVPLAARDRRDNVLV